jgi:tetratricopeptide (TPR) repeat protein
MQLIGHFKCYNFIALGLTTLMISCGSAPKTEPIVVAPAPKPQISSMSQGLQAYKAGEWELGLEKFDQVIQSGANPNQAGDAYFYSAVCLKGLKRWQESNERFKKFLALQAQKNIQYQAMALYEMAENYEALGEESLAIAALNDALNRADALEPEVRVEILARLAGVYARIGNESEASIKYEQAESALSKLRKNSRQKTPPRWLPKTLFNMGKMSLKKITVTDFSLGLKPLERGQVWLLRAARLGHEDWSAKASFELIQVYKDAWAVIEAVPLKQEEDQLVALKEQQTQKVNMAVSLYNLVSRLKLERGFDFQKENKYEREIFENTSQLEKNLEIILKSRPVEQTLTPNAQEKEGIKRK